MFQYTMDDIIDLHPDEMSFFDAGATAAETTSSSSDAVSTSPPALSTTSSQSSSSVPATGAASSSVTQTSPAVPPATVASVAGSVRQRDTFESVSSSNQALRPLVRSNFDAASSTVAARASTGASAYGTVPPATKPRVVISRGRLQLVTILHNDTDQRPGNPHPMSALLTRAHIVTIERRTAELQHRRRPREHLWHPLQWMLHWRLDELLRSPDLALQDLSHLPAPQNSCSRCAEKSLGTHASSGCARREDSDNLGIMCSACLGICTYRRAFAEHCGRCAGYTERDFRVIWLGVRLHPNDVRHQCPVARCTFATVTPAVWSFHSIIHRHRAARPLELVTMPPLYEWQQQEQSLALPQEKFVEFTNALQALRPRVNFDIIDLRLSQRDTFNSSQHSLGAWLRRNMRSTLPPVVASTPASPPAAPVAPVLPPAPATTSTASTPMTSSTSPAPPPVTSAVVTSASASTSASESASKRGITSPSSTLSRPTESATPVSLDQIPLPHAPPPLSAWVRPPPGLPVTPRPLTSGAWKPPALPPAVRVIPLRLGSRGRPRSPRGGVAFNPRHTVPLVALTPALGSDRPRDPRRPPRRRSVPDVSPASEDTDAKRQHTTTVHSTDPMTTDDDGMPIDSPTCYRDSPRRTSSLPTLVNTASRPPLTLRDRLPGPLSYRGPLCAPGLGTLGEVGITGQLQTGHYVVRGRDAKTGQLRHPHAATWQAEARSPLHDPMPVSNIQLQVHLDVVRRHGSVYAGRLCMAAALVGCDSFQLTRCGASASDVVHGVIVRR